MRKKPELLAPAGDMEKLRMAVLYGADAVYLAGTSFGMRSFAGNFTADELPEAGRFAHDHGVRVLPAPRASRPNHTTPLRTHSWRCSAAWRCGARTSARTSPPA